MVVVADVIVVVVSLGVVGPMEETEVMVEDVVVAVFVVVVPDFVVLSAVVGWLMPLWLLCIPFHPAE